MAIKAKITTSSIKKLKPSDKRLTDTEIRGFHARIHASGNIHYYLYYKTHGREGNFKIGSHGQLTPSEAREIAKVKSGELARGIDIQKSRLDERQETERQRANQLGKYLAEHYKPWLEARNAKTANRIIQTIQSGFADFLKTPLSEITARKVEQWRNQKVKAQMGKATVNHYVNSLKGAMSRAVEWDLIPSHDLKKVKTLKVESTRLRYLSPDEEESLLSTLRERDERLKAARDQASEFRRVRNYPTQPDLREQKYSDHLEPIVLLAMNTGMRRGEIFQLQWSNIDFYSKTLTVEAGNAKSGKSRIIPLNDNAFHVLENWKPISQSQYVFHGKDKDPLTDIKKGFLKVLEEAEIKEFRFHDLRHHFASKLVMRGVDLNTVRELLGHADIKMTLRYAHLAPEHKARAVSLL
ncbi:site-specific integrase [Idiomarina loihiensis]|uniref:site-specific integrase n=1 Tax=Idiomarina loihiensis TaxID=135577 RepID=UPI00129C2DE5|nr:site-specific integrase [Idiomarina loihiensis]MRJ44957.1 tyrosine-type recombinase/integrase [Idiomarina loihiensis]UTW33090.1 site-specific integrase [Idiomarina loihiensis]